MSNSTRPGGYDERLVVPLEASRRGAHRARINPLMSALPVLAVVVVVLAVIGVAYTLFVKGSNSADDTATGTVPATSAPAATNPAPTSDGSPGASSSAKPSASRERQQLDAGGHGRQGRRRSPSTTAPSTKCPGLAAKKANTALNGEGFSKGGVVSGNPARLPEPDDAASTTRLPPTRRPPRPSRRRSAAAPSKLNPTIAADRASWSSSADDYNG